MTTTCYTFNKKQLQLQLVKAEDKQIPQKLAQEKLSGEVKSSEAELIAAREFLDFLKNQLNTLENKSQAVQAVNIKLAAEVVNQKQAIIFLSSSIISFYKSNFFETFTATQLQLIKRAIRF